MVKHSYRFAVITLAVLCVGGLSFFAYRMLRADIAASVYRQRLEKVATEYNALAARYNEAVRKTAVTELVVMGRILSVTVRDADGVVTTVPTPFDPAKEIYVDYVVLDGRLWIRRVFDESTAPERGVLIEPTLAKVNWEDPKLAHGQAVYRSLSDGRWVVSVSGDGALGLTKSADNAPTDLAVRPEIKKFDEVTAEADAQASAIGFGDIWQLLTGN